MKVWNRWTGPAPIAERFWSKVNKDGPIPAHRPELGPCWVWTAGFYGKGNRAYGGFWFNGRTVYASRVSYEITHGPIPNGLFVCHHCDNPSCVRPDHLFLGTNSANILDAIAKGRLKAGYYLPWESVPRGEKHWNCKLSDEKVADIQKRLASGEKGIALSREFDVSPATISMIGSGKRRGTSKHSISLPRR